MSVYKNYSLHLKKTNRPPPKPLFLRVGTIILNSAWKISANFQSSLCYNYSCVYKQCRLYYWVALTGSQVIVSLPRTLTPSSVFQLILFMLLVWIVPILPRSSNSFSDLQFFQPLNKAFRDCTRSSRNDEQNRHFFFQLKITRYTALKRMLVYC